MVPFRRFGPSALLLALLLSACFPTGITRDQAIQAAMSNAPPSDVPISVESALDGRLDRFYTSAVGEEAGRHVWAVGLVGSFRPLEGAGPSRHHVVILDFTTGEFMFGFRLAVAEPRDIARR